MNFLDSLAASKATGLAIFIWLIALLMAGGAAMEARLKADGRTKVSLVAAATPSKIRARDEEVAAGEYQKVIDDLSKVHTNVRISSGGGRGTTGVSVEVKSIADYYTFVIVVYDIMTAIPDARWSFQDMCAGEKCTRAAYAATLKAARKKVSLVEG